MEEQIIEQKPKSKKKALIFASIGIILIVFALFSIFSHKEIEYTDSMRCKLLGLGEYKEIDGKDYCLTENKEWEVERNGKYFKLVNPAL